MKIIFVAVAVLTLAAATDAGVGFTPFGRVPGTTEYFVPNDVSGDGSLVSGASLGGTNMAAYWSSATGLARVTDTDDGPAAASSYAIAVSEDGTHLAGYGMNRTTGFSEPTRNRVGEPLQGLSNPGDLVHGRARGLSRGGAVVVGLQSQLTGYVAFRWTAETGMVSLGVAPNSERATEANGVSADGTVAVGRLETAAFRWTPSTGLVVMKHLSQNHSITVPYAVSADGLTAVGASAGSDSNRYAVAWDETGAIRSLGQLPGGSLDSWASDVSGDGSIIVGNVTRIWPEGPRGFVWDQSHGMRTVSDFLATYGITTPGWTLSSISGISSDGTTLIGLGRNPAGETQGWMATIPAPGLAIPIFFAFGMVRRSRRNSQRA